MGKNLDAHDIHTCMRSPYIINYLTHKSKVTQSKVTQSKVTQSYTYSLGLAWLGKMH